MCSVHLLSFNANDSDVSDVAGPVIVGILAVAVLFLIVACLLIGFCYRGSDTTKEVYVEPADSDRGSDFTYVTEVYVDGNQKRRLMVGQPAAFIVGGSNRDRGFLN